MSADPNDLTSQIQTTAANPSTASQDGLSVGAQPLPDLIAADKYLLAKEASGAAPWGLQFAKIISPGQGNSYPGSNCR